MSAPSAAAKVGGSKEDAGRPLVGSLVSRSRRAFSAEAVAKKAAAVRGAVGHVVVEMAEMSMAKSAGSPGSSGIFLRHSARTTQEALAWIQKAIQTLHSPECPLGVTYLESLNGVVERVEQKFPVEFMNIRSSLEIKDYMAELCTYPLQAAPEYFGSYAYHTSSKRFLVQALDLSLAGTLLDRLPRFLRHIDGWTKSLLPRFLGMYCFNSALPPQFSHIVVYQTSPFCGAAMDYIYELNGVGPDRFAHRTGAHMQVLHDANFVEEQQVVMVPAQVHTSLIQQLREDTSLLELMGIDNYSLVLGIRKADNEQRENRPGGSAIFSSMMEASDLPFEGPSDSDAHGDIGWRMNREPVRYFFGLTNIINCPPPRRSFVFSLKSRLSAKGFNPTTYRTHLLSFLEDRILPIACTSSLSFDKNVAKFKYQPRRGSAREMTEINALALLAVAELEDRSTTPPSREDIHRWRALVDLVEAGPRAIGLWRELQLVEVDLEKMLPVFCADLARTPLPSFNGSTEQAQQPKGVALARIGKLLKSVQQIRALRTVGGGLVSMSSKQYSLALAIAVGVEAATTCSASISKRSADIFARHPELHRRPAAVMAKRTFFLPEAGSWRSPPHMLPDLKFVEYAPEIFAEIRRSTGMDDQGYIRCVCPRDFSFIEFTTNSKSGEFFFFTHDGQCMVKTICREEVDSLLRLLSHGYLEHLNSKEGSLLTRIIGLYEVHLPWFNKGQPQCFIIQENLLADCGPNVRERFDLKGSQFGRTAKPGDLVLKDNDWTDGGYKLEFPPELCEKIRRSHRRDCNFLSACGCIDYSVFVVVSHRAAGTASASSAQPSRRGSIMLGASDSEGDHREHRRGDGRTQEERGEDGEGEQVRARRSKSLGRRGPRMSMLLSADAEGRPQIAPKRPGQRLWDKLRSTQNLASEAQDPWSRPHGPFEGSDRALYKFGIIDFLIPWSFKKRAEFLYHASQCRANEASVMPPRMYAQRQIKFMGNFW